MIDFNLNPPIDKEAPAKSPKGKKSVFTLAKGLIVVVLLAALAGLGYMYYNTRQQLDMLSTPGGQQELSRQEVARIKESLGKLTLLPDEDPLLATIIDSQYLATQSAFYQNAQNGDKLVVFSNAKKAYIYSPERNIIVNSGPLITNSDAQVPAGEELQIEIRNGTTVTGLGTQIQSQIEGPGIVVTGVNDAVNRTFTQTQVIGLNSSVSQENLSLVAQKIGGVVAPSIPTTEEPSEADILIIAGRPAATQAPAASSPAPSPTQEP